MYWSESPESNRLRRAWKARMHHHNADSRNPPSAPTDGGVKTLGSFRAGTPNCSGSIRKKEDAHEDL